MSSGVQLKTYADWPTTRTASPGASEGGPERVHTRAAGGGDLQVPSLRVCTQICACPVMLEFRYWRALLTWRGRPLNRLTHHRLSSRETLQPYMLFKVGEGSHVLSWKLSPRCDLRDEDGRF